MTAKPEIDAPGETEEQWRSRLSGESWQVGGEAVARVRATVAECIASPAFQAQANVEAREHEFAARRYFEVAIEALYVAERVLADGVQCGAINPSRAFQARAFASEFTSAAYRGVRAICKATPCEYRGPLMAIGPAMLCPLCGQRSLDIVTLAVPSPPKPPASGPTGLVT